MCVSAHTALFIFLKVPVSHKAAVSAASQMSIEQKEVSGCLSACKVEIRRHLSGKNTRKETKRCIDQNYPCRGVLMDVSSDHRLTAVDLLNSIIILMHAQ